MEVQALIDEAVHEAEQLVAAAKSEGDRDLTEKESGRLAELEATAKGLHDKVVAAHQANELVIEQRKVDAERLAALKNMTPIDGAKMAFEAEPEAKPVTPAAAAAKSLGESFVSSKAYAADLAAGAVDIAKAKAGGYKSDEGVGLKTLLTSPTTSTQASVRAIEIFIPRLMDLVTVMPSSSDLILSHRYSITSAAAETAAGASKPEAALTVASVTITPKKVAVSLPVIMEALTDHPRMRVTIDELLTNDVVMAVESLIATDLAAWSGLATTAFDTDMTTSILKGKTASNTYTRSNGILVSDTDYETLALTAAAVGQQLAHGPFGAGQLNIWGLPVYSSGSMADGFAYVGDLSMLVWNEVWPLRTSTGWVAQQFVENELTILAETRGALDVFNNLHITKADLVA